MTPLLPADAIQLMPEILAVIERLSEVLIRENAILAEAAPKLDTALSVEKSRLVVRYESLLTALTRLPVAIVRACPGAERLADAVRRLNELAKANAAAITRHLRATRHVIDLVARAARNQTQARFSYGKERLGYGARGGRQQAVAVNRVY